MRPVAIILLAGALSCGGSDTEPGNPLGPIGTTYQLTTYDDSSLPALYSASLGKCAGQVRSGFLTAVGTNQALFGVSISAPCTSGNPVTTTIITGTLSTSSAGLVLSFAPPNVSEAYADTIVLGTSTATMRHRGGASTQLEPHSYYFTKAD